MRFIYEPLKLSGNSIRLVELLPGQKDEKISCRLAQYAIHRRPPYNAVSYTWGALENSDEILLQNQTFLIGRNLWLLLNDLRSEHYSEMLWIDAICINQEDISERNHQVRLMAQIYERADRVYSWLGPKTADSDLALDFVQELANDLRDETIDNEDVTDKYFQNEYAAQWVGLGGLCHREYWKRTWILQEVILAINIRIYCGDHYVDWHSFEISAQFAERYMQKVKLSTVLPPQGIEAHVQKVAFSFADRLYQQRISRQVSNLRDLLGRYHDSLCRDPRDRVYALLGLASDCGWDEGLIADYSKSTIELYAEVIKFCKPTESEMLKFGAEVQEMLSIQQSDIDKFLDGCLATAATPIRTSVGDPFANFSYERPVVGIVIEIDHEWTLSRISSANSRRRWFERRKPIMNKVADNECFHLQMGTANMGNHFYKRVLQDTERPKKIKLRIDGEIHDGFACRQVKVGDRAYQFPDSEVLLVVGTDRKHFELPVGTGVSFYQKRIDKSRDDQALKWMAKHGTIESVQTMRRQPFAPPVMVGCLIDLYAHCSPSWSLMRAEHFVKSTGTTLGKAPMP